MSSKETELNDLPTDGITTVKFCPDNRERLLVTSWDAVSISCTRNTPLHRHALSCSSHSSHLCLAPMLAECTRL